MTRTYGTVEYRSRADIRAARGQWVLEMEPAVAIRAKRFFARAERGLKGRLEMNHSIEVARDIEWFTARFPLEHVNAETTSMLTAGAAAHRHREIAVAQVMKSTTRLDAAEGVLLKTPYAHQLRTLELLRIRNRTLNTDEVGLGKTLTGLLALTLPDSRPALVVPPTHLPPRWVTELNESMPWLTVEVAKKTTPPQHIIDGDLPDVVIVPYSKIDGWQDALATRVHTVIFDEVQDLRRGTTSNKGWAAKRIADEANYVLGLTATPVYNYGGEVWQLLNIIAPGELGTSAEFTREWGHSGANGHIHVASPDALGSYLREQGLMIGHTRDEVGHDLPKAIKVPELVSSDPKILEQVAGDAAAMARLILSDSSTRTERFQAAGELDWKLREATGIAKAPYVAEFVRLILESEQRVALFGWHRAVWELWNDALAEFNPVMFTGSESATQKQRALDQFTDGDSRILMMSLRSGAGVDGLQKVCSVAVFGELDWSPQVHEQAIGRFRRDGMDIDKPVVAYFLHSEEGSDPMLLETLQIKRNQAEPLVSKDGKLLDNSTQDTSRGRALAELVLRMRGDAVPNAPMKRDLWEAPPLWDDAVSPTTKEDQHA